MGSHRDLDRDLAIARHFPPPDLDHWRRAAEESLGGRSLASLRSRTADGLVVEPLYCEADRPDDSLQPALPGEGWQACQLLEGTDPTVAARRIADAGSLGLGAVWAVLDRTLRSGDETAPPDGLLLDDAHAVGRLVDALPDPGVRLILDGGAAALPLAAACAAVRSPEAPWRDLVAIHHDPLGALAADGALPFSLDRSLTLLADLARCTGRTAPDLRTVSVSTLPYAEAGATAGQELAFLLATGVEYLRALTAAGLDAAAACRQLTFVVAVGRDLFEEQAKLRAARRLWGRVVEACGIAEETSGMVLHAVTSRRVLTRRDRWSNALRATVGAFAAVTGGADLVTILPSDAACGSSSEEAARVAALTHAILREEAALDRVIDPAAGSYYLERLTDDLARTAWAHFQRLERTGGMARAVLDGIVRSEVEEAASRRRDAVAHRRTPVTGVSSFPDLDEEPPPRAAPRSRPTAPAAQPPGAGGRGAELERLAAAAPGDGAVTAAAIDVFRAGATLSEVVAALGDGRPRARVEPLSRDRDAEPFESLRDAADRFDSHHGHRPRAFLAGLGAPAEHRRAATLAANLLAAGGIEASSPHGCPTVDQGADAFAGSGARIAVICTAGSRRDEMVPALARALKGRGAGRVLVAAGPAELPQGWRRAGVDAVLSEGVDLVALLRELLAVAGVPR